MVCKWFFKKSFELWIIDEKKNDAIKNEKMKIL